MNEKKFIDLYQRQKESGLTVKEFCSNEVIAPATFYYWCKKLRSRNRLPGFIPVVVNPISHSPEHNIIDKQVVHDQECPPNGTKLEIEFPNKTVLRINGGFDLSILKSLIHLSD